MRTYFVDRGLPATASQAGGTEGSATARVLASSKSASSLSMPDSGLWPPNPADGAEGAAAARSRSRFPQPPLLQGQHLPPVQQLAPGSGRPPDAIAAAVAAGDESGAWGTLALSSPFGGSNLKHRFFERGHFRQCPPLSSGQQQPDAAPGRSGGFFNYDGRLGGSLNGVGFASAAGPGEAAAEDSSNLSASGNNGNRHPAAGQVRRSMEGQRAWHSIVPVGAQRERRRVSASLLLQIPARQPIDRDGGGGRDRVVLRRSASAVIPSPASAGGRVGGASAPGSRSGSMKSTAGTGISGLDAEYGAADAAAAAGDRDSLHGGQPEEPATSYEDVRYAQSWLPARIRGVYEVRRPGNGCLDSRAGSKTVGASEALHSLPQYSASRHRP